MTKRERAQVVELLRCAADWNRFYPVAYALGHCDGLAPCSRAMSLAMDAFFEIHRRGVGYWNNPRRALLEAALRVEQGEWP